MSFLHHLLRQLLGQTKSTFGAIHRIPATTMESLIDLQLTSQSATTAPNKPNAHPDNIFHNVSNCAMLANNHAVLPDAPVRGTAVAFPPSSLLDLFSTLDI